MQNKKIMMLAIFLLSMLAIGVASAADNGSGDIAAINDINVINDGNTINELQEDINQDSLGVSDDGDNVIADDATDDTVGGEDTRTKTATFVDNVTANPRDNVSIRIELYAEDNLEFTSDVDVQLPDGTNTTIKVINGFANLNWQIPNGYEGIYQVTAKFKATDKYQESTGTGYITVNKVATDIKVANVTVYPSQSAEVPVDFNLNIAEKFNGLLNVTLPDGKQETINITNGKGKVIWKIPADFKFQYTMDFSFADDGRYTSCQAQATIFVEKIPTAITIGDDSSNPGKTVTLPITVTCNDGNPFNGNVNVTLPASAAQPVEIVNGSGNVTWKIPDGYAGDYKVIVSFAENGTHLSSNATGVVHVSKYTTQLTAADVSTTYNVNKDLVITLKGETGVMKNTPVSVDLNGAKKYTTDANGQIKIATGALTPKAYDVKISFAGSDNYLASSASAKVTVEKAKPKLTAKSKTYKNTAKTKKYSITLKDNTGKALSNAKVTIKVKGKTYKATTDAKGKATFTLKLNVKGKYSAVVTYNGNKYYAKSTKKVKLTLKKSTFDTVGMNSKDKKLVKKIQRALKSNGYYITFHGKKLHVDGNFNKYTKQAVKDFQKDKGLKVTGKVDQATAEKLKLI